MTSRLMDASPDDRCSSLARYINPMSRTALSETGYFYALANDHVLSLVQKHDRPRAEEPNYAAGAILGADAASPLSSPRAASAGEARKGPRRLRHWKALVQRRSVFAGDDLQRLTRKLQNVEPGVRAIDNVDIPAVVGCHIVRLNHSPTDIRIALIWSAPIIRIRSDGRDEERDVFGFVRIADIKGGHASVEVRDEHDFLVERRPEFLVCRVRPEAATDVAEPAFGCRHLRSGNRLRPSLVRDIRHKREMAKLGAKMRCRLRGYHHNIAHAVVHVVDLIVTGICDEIGDNKPPEWKAGMGAVVRVHDQISEHGGVEVGTGRGCECRGDRAARHS